MRFRYQAKSGPGEIKNGVIEADNRLLVVAKLRQEGLFPLAIEDAASPAAQKDRRVPASDISLFTRQLSDLVGSGFTLDSALGILACQARTPALGQLIVEIRQGLEKGMEFSRMLAQHPASFSGFYVSVVRIGEAGGRLEDSLRRLADFKEREEQFLAQLKSALAYPAFLLLVGLASILVLTAFFIPRLAQMFADFGQALPLSTRLVIYIGALLSRYWWLGIIFILAGALAARSLLAKEDNRFRLDSLALAVPLVRGLVCKIESARFAYALGVLLKSGVPILEGLGIASLNVANRRLRLVISSFDGQIRKGHSLSSCLKNEKQFFSEAVYRMTAVGEETGELGDMLLKIAHLFEKEVNQSLKSGLALFEPFLVLFIGGFLVLIVFSMLLPVFQLDFFPH